MKNQKKKAFTLVELLVVIAILAILATVSIIGYSSFIGRARKSNAQTEAAQANEVIIAEVISTADGKADIGSTGLYFAYKDGKLSVNGSADAKKADKDISTEMKAFAEGELAGLPGTFKYDKEKDTVVYERKFFEDEIYDVDVFTNKVTNAEGTTPEEEEEDPEPTVTKYTVTFSAGQNGSVDKNSLEVEEGTTFTISEDYNGVNTITFKKEGKTVGTVKATPNRFYEVYQIAPNPSSSINTKPGNVYEVVGDVTLSITFGRS